MNLTFYGTIESLEVNGSTVTLRCVREYFPPDGLLSDDVWLWSISDVAQIAEARTVLGRSICGFETDERGLRVWFDEGDESMTISGSRISKTEESRSRSDLARVVGELSTRTQRDESARLALTKRMREIATSIYQRIDRLQRRAEFEQQRRSETPKEFAREIEDLHGILRQLEEPNQAPLPTPVSVTPAAGAPVAPATGAAEL